MKKWLKSFAFISSLGLISGVPVKAQVAQEQKEQTQIPTLEECLENNLEFLSAVEEELGENFNVSFTRDDTIYLFNKYSDELIVTIIRNENTEKKHRIHSQGGLLDLVEGEESIDSKTTRQYYRFNAPSFFLYPYVEREEPLLNSEELLSELQKNLYTALIYTFEHLDKSTENIFRKKVMPQDYFNSMNNSVGRMIRSVEKYGEEVFDIYHKKKLAYELNGFKYSIEVQHDFFNDSAFLKTNTKLRREINIEIKIYHPNTDLFCFVMDVDPVFGDVVEYMNKFNQEPFRAKWLHQYAKELNELQTLGENVQEIINYVNENYSLE